MAIIETACQCGEKVTVRTGADCKTPWRADKKQVVYTGDENRYGEREYDIFRCIKCLMLIENTCKEAAYGLPV